VALPDVRATAVHGREAEQELVAAVVRSVQAGRSGVLVVQGPAGIGKTTLVEDAVRGRDIIDGAQRGYFFTMTHR